MSYDYEWKNDVLLIGFRRSFVRDSGGVSGILVHVFEWNYLTMTVWSFFERSFLNVKIVKLHSSIKHQANSELILIFFK